MLPKLKNFWVVMPVYNEEEALPLVLDEWIPKFREHFGTNYTFCILNDGSKDGTQKMLDAYALKYEEIRAVHKQNSGHGQSCIEGYKLALKNNAEWIFQIDSDGQCVPKFFDELVEKVEPAEVAYGFRKTRGDGLQRFLVSRFVSLFVFGATGVWVKDANVPYRLMSMNSLSPILEKIPKDFHLCNILVSTYQKKTHGIEWVNIHFRDRQGGSASVKTVSFVKHGIHLFRQLSTYYKSLYK